MSSALERKILKRITNAESYTADFGEYDTTYTLNCGLAIHKWGPPAVAYTFRFKGAYIPNLSISKKIV